MEKGLVTVQIAVIHDAPRVLVVAAAQPAVGQAGVEAGFRFSDVELIVDERVEGAAGAGVDSEHACLALGPGQLHGVVALVHGEADALVGGHMDAAMGDADAAAGFAVGCLVGVDDEFGIFGPGREAGERGGGEDGDDGEGVDVKLHGFFLFFFGRV